MRETVFSNPEARDKLEAITHPRIEREVIQRAAQSSASYCLIVVPLMVESGLNRVCDTIVVVTTPLEKRIEWIAKRSQLDREEILNIINAQATERTTPGAS